VCREIREGYICYLWMWRIRISEGGDDESMMLKMKMKKMMATMMAMNEDSPTVVDMCAFCFSAAMAPTL
jgi:hypothetical protein